MPLMKQPKIDPARQVKLDAAALVGAAVAHQGISRLTLSLRSGLDSGTVNDFLGGRRWPRPDTIGAIEGALGWRMGCIDRLARGETTIEEIVAEAQQAAAVAAHNGKVPLDLELADYEDLTEAERAEATSAATAAFLRSVREIRAAR